MNGVKDRNIRLTVAYDGSRYHGWQRQDNGITIQEVMEKKISLMADEPVALIASGRTDAGVHALAQVCNFRTGAELSANVFRSGLNSLLPDDIFVKEARDMPLEFHSRYSAKKKTYEYRILNLEERDIFRRLYSWHIRTPLDTDNMGKCLDMLKGKLDFSSFRSTGSENRDPVRNLSRAQISGPGGGMIRIVIEADGFLRHMVRNIVGTVVDAGLGKISVETFKSILEARDRSSAGIKAPPQGLFLVEVNY